MQADLHAASPPSAVNEASTQRSKAAPSASSLAKENATLKARLQQVEEAASEALGELQDAQDELDAHKEARQAAEQQVGTTTATHCCS